MRHLDVAGGTGDVAFRVYKAIRDAERLRDAAAALHPASSHSQQQHSQPPMSPDDGASEPLHAASSYAARGVDLSPVGSVIVCDINAAMLKEGERKAAAQGIGEPDTIICRVGGEKHPMFIRVHHASCQETCL